MKKIKIFIIAAVFMITGFVMGACGSTVVAEQTYPLKIFSQNRNGQMETWNVVDDDTGVNYVVVAPRWSEHGYEYTGVCVTPRLNADGSLYVGRQKFNFI